MKYLNEKFSVFMGGDPNKTKCDYCYNFNSKECATCQCFNHFKKWNVTSDAPQETPMQGLGELGKP
jgi:hypothetical protein